MAVTKEQIEAGANVLDELRLHHRAYTTKAEASAVLTAAAKVAPIAAPRAFEVTDELTSLAYRLLSESDVHKSLSAFDVREALKAVSAELGKAQSSAGYARPPVLPIDPEDEAVVDRMVAERVKGVAVKRPIEPDSAGEQAVRRAFEAGFDCASEHAEISEHNGWHPVEPYIDWAVAKRERDKSLAEMAVIKPQPAASEPERAKDNDEALRAAFNRFAKLKLGGVPELSAFWTAAKPLVSAPTERERELERQLEACKRFHSDEHNERCEIHKAFLAEQARADKAEAELSAAKERERELEQNLALLATLSAHASLRAEKAEAELAAAKEREKELERERNRLRAKLELLECGPDDFTPEQAMAFDLQRRHNVEADKLRGELAAAKERIKGLEEELRIREIAASHYEGLYELLADMREACARPRNGNYSLHYWLHKLESIKELEGSEPAGDKLTVEPLSVHEEADLQHCEGLDGDVQLVCRMLRKRFPKPAPKSALEELLTTWRTSPQYGGPYMLAADQVEAAIKADQERGR